jgi:hypothetical protein
MFKIKVLERESDFIAAPNLSILTESGEWDGICGMGQSEVEALQDAIERVMEILATRDRWEEDQLVWSDPTEF